MDYFEHAAAARVSHHFWHLSQRARHIRIFGLLFWELRRLLEYLQMKGSR